VDFNPAGNALRIVSDTGLNLRQPFGAGDAPTVTTVVDDPLTLNGSSTATGIVAAAYTNNDLTDTTATMLFDIDTDNDQVLLQLPADSGMLSPTGDLGIGAGSDVGFDIYSEVSSSGDATVATSASRPSPWEPPTGSTSSIC